MSYTITRFDGISKLSLVQDGSINSTLDITLIGEDYPGYGSIQNENFVYLLENFANNNPPPNAIYGQIWFDSGYNKLKYLGTNGEWKSTGGTEVSNNPPIGLNDGDLWFDKINKQLNIWDNDSSNFILVGPPVGSDNLSQLISATVKDNSSPPVSYTVILAYVNNKVIYTISSSNAFTVGSNTIPGFDNTAFPIIYQGITSAYTTQITVNSTTVIETSSTSNNKFYGTATNADSLGGQPFSSYLNQNSPNFTNLVNFSDSGFTVGTNTPKLKVFIDTNNIPNIGNVNSNELLFSTKSTNGSTNFPLTLVDNNILPSIDNSSSIGSGSYRYSDIYGVNLHGNATSSTTSNNLIISGTNYSGSTTSVASTIVARDTNSDIFCNILHGTATSAYYADLAEKYLADKEYEVGTVMVVGGDKEVCACNVNSNRPIGVVSSNPAFIMNYGLKDGTYIALKGRVPVKVVGFVNKGDYLIPGNNGCGMSGNSNHSIFAIALESGSNIVECVIL